VYFIEPYRKSLATKLHGDALSEVAQGSGKVRLLQFDGVAPRRFIDMFEAGDRKREGVLKLLSKVDASPTSRVSVKAIPRLEEAVVAEVTSKHLRVLGLIDAEDRTNGNDTREPEDDKDPPRAA
jgi:predicted DNA-binding antitoxin AbrB/MazE fold protein